MFSEMLGSLKQSATFHLPGKIDTSSNFKATPPATLALAFDGTKMLDALEKLMADDAWLAKNGYDMQDAPELDNEFGGLLFGEKAPPISPPTRPR